MGKEADLDMMGDEGDYEKDSQVCDQEVSNNNLFF